MCLNFGSRVVDCMDRETCLESDESAVPTNHKYAKDPAAHTLLSGRVVAQQGSSCTASRMRSIAEYHAEHGLNRLLDALSTSPGSPGAVQLL